MTLWRPSYSRPGKNSLWTSWIIFRVGLVSGGDDRTFQGNTGEKSLAAAVCIYSRAQGQAGLGVAPDGTSRYTQGTPEGDVASFRERVNSFRSVEYNYKLRDLSPNLKAKSYSSRTDCRRTAPALFDSRNDNPGPASATDDESSFGDGEDRQPFCFAHDCRRNCRLRNLLEAFNDHHGLVNVVLHGSMGGSSRQVRAE